MAKDKSNNMLIPPDGGRWLFILKSGRSYGGLLLDRFDDGVVFSPQEGIIAAIPTREIESMWQGLPAEEKEKSKEA